MDANASLQAVGVEDLVDARGACPLCGATLPRETVGFFQRRPRVSLLWCGVCGGASASHLPSDAYLKRFYESDYGPAHVTATERNAQRLTHHIARVLALPSSGRVLRVLDFGGNDGRMALRLAETWLRAGAASRVEIVVVDYVEVVSSHDSRIQLIGARAVPPQPGSFDVVLASAVFEHVSRPGRVLSEVLRGLAPGGRMYARTPYMAPLSRVLGRAVPYFPAHVHDLGPAFWERVPATFGVKVELVRSTPSVVETAFREAPVTTTLAHVLKLPARVQQRLYARLPIPRVARWPWVGGWEVVFHRAG